MRPEVVPFQKSLPQLRSVVHLAISAHPLGAEAPAREALMALREMDDRADVRSRASTAIRIVENIEANDITPEGFADAIKFGCRRANIQPHDLAKRSGSGWKLHDWLSGRSAPDRFSSFGHVQAIERLLGFKSGTLWDRVRFRSPSGGTIDKEYWPVEVPKKAAIRSEVKLYLPDDILVRPEAERRDLFLAAYAIVAMKREKHVDANHAANCADPYWHKRPDWSAALAAEGEQLIEFHSFVKDIDFDDEDEGAFWVPGSQERNIGYVERAMGVALKQQIFERSELTFGLFAIPKFATTVINFVKPRRRKSSVPEVGGEVESYGTDDIQLLVMAKMMVAKGGFLRQRPEFFDKLCPRAQEMLAIDLKGAGDDWNAICDAAHAKYERGIEKVKKWLKNRGPQTSTPKKRIEEILSKDKDLHDYRAAFGAVLAARLKKCEPGYRAWAHATEDLVLHKMLAQFPNRSRAIREATWKADHTGSVGCVDGKWEWRTHWSSVKNARYSGHFRDKEWHVAKLIDEDGLFAALHDYTRPGGARDWLLDGRSSDSFFVLASDEPEMDARRLYAKYARSTLAVLAKIDDPRWSETRCYGPHAERKIVFNALRGRADAPNAKENYSKACGALMIGPITASKYYEYASPGERAAGIAKELAHEQKQRS